MKRFDRGGLAVFLALLAAPWIAFSPAFIPKALLDGGDDLLANLPELLYSGRKLLEGEILWTPALWMGHPLLAEPEFATFYFPKLLLLLGTPVVAYAVYVVLHFLAAEFGGYAYLRSLGIGRTGAVFGALAYAYAGFMVGHRGHTMYVCAGAWTPFVFLAFDRAAERGGRLACLAAALAFAMVPFSGAVQLTVYLASTILLVASVRSVLERSWRTSIGALACLVPALMIAAVQLVPSHDFARQLATDLRGDYELDVMHSFHPILFSTLALPVPPENPELYSRAGVVVLCAVAVTLARLRDAPARIRAWAFVAGVALLLMFGRYFAPLARLLHGLPVVGVLRGPARHNFELGLAVSVLGAYGVDQAMRAGAGRLRYWLAGGAAFAVLSYGAVRLAETHRVRDVAAAGMLGDVTWTVGLVAAVAFAAWVAALRWRTSRVAALLWALVAVAPMLETAWAVRAEGRTKRSALGLVEEAEKALPEPGSTVRLLSPSMLRASADDLAGNTVLFHPGVESLQGYSSIAYSAARQILELDMHGQPSFYDELAFSVLPSVFGVTHLVLPNAYCEDDRWSVAPTGPACVLGRASDPESARAPDVVVAGELACNMRDVGTGPRYRLAVAARALGSERSGASFSYLWGPRWDDGTTLEIAGSSLGPDAVVAGRDIRLGDGDDYGGLVAENHGRSPVVFSDAGLRVERDGAVASLDGVSPSELVTERAAASRGALRLDPDGAMAGVRRRVRWPREARPEDGRAVVRVEARALSSAPGDLVVDLYTESGYDPESAQLVVPASELRSEWMRFEARIDVSSAPEEFWLRAFSSGKGAVEIRGASLLARVGERVVPFPAATNRDLHHARVEHGRVTMDPKSRTGGAVYLPVRAFEIVLDAEAASHGVGAVHFGIQINARYSEPRTWRVEGDDFDRRVRMHHVAIVPPDEPDPNLFVHVDGAEPLRVHELSASDACVLRGYRNPRRLANGLFLYENPHALPRAYAVASVIRADDPRAVRRALLDFGPDDLGRKAVVGANLPAGLTGGVVESAVFAARRNDVVVRAEAGPTLLVENERFDPDWHATLDGAPVDVVRVNGFARGVVVPVGTHRIHFEYRVPDSVWLGLAICIAGVLAALFVSPAILRSSQKSV